MEDPDLAAEIVPTTSPQAVTRQLYRQLWLNQIYFTYLGFETGMYSQAQWEALRRDIRAFAQESEVLSGWTDSRDFYPESFQRFLDAEILAPTSNK